MEDKIKKLQERMPQEVDAFLTADEKTVLYLTGFDMTDGALFVMRDEAFLLVDFRYIEAEREIGRASCRERV